MPAALLEQQPDQGRTTKAAASALNARDSLFLRQEEQLAEIPLREAHFARAQGDQPSEESRDGLEKAAQDGCPSVAFRLVGFDLCPAMSATAQEVLGLDGVEDIHRYASVVDGAEELARDVNVVHVAR